MVDADRCFSDLSAWCQKSTSMADAVLSEQTVYGCTGNPLPADIEEVLNWLLTEEFQSVFDKIRAVQQTKGLALVDIVRDLHPYVMTLDITQRSRAYLLHHLADLEYRLASGTTESVQLSSLVAMFFEARVQNIDAAQ